MVVYIYLQYFVRHGLNLSRSSELFAVTHYKGLQGILFSRTEVLTIALICFD